MILWFYWTLNSGFLRGEIFIRIKSNVFFLIGLFKSRFEHFNRLISNKLIVLLLITSRYYLIGLWCITVAIIETLLVLSIDLMSLIYILYWTLWGVQILISILLCVVLVVLIYYLALLANIILVVVLILILHVFLYNSIIVK